MYKFSVKHANYLLDSINLLASDIRGSEDKKELITKIQEYNYICDNNKKLINRLRPCLL